MSSHKANTNRHLASHLPFKIFSQALILPPTISILYPSWSPPFDQQSLALDLKTMSISVTPAQASTSSSECSRSRSPSACAHSHCTASRSASPHMSTKAFPLNIKDSSEAEQANHVAHNATQPELTSIASCSDVSESGSFGLNPE